MLFLQKQEPPPPQVAWRSFDNGKQCRFSYWKTLYFEFFNFFRMVVTTQKERTQVIEIKKW